MDSVEALIKFVEARICAGREHSLPASMPILEPPEPTPARFISSYFLAEAHAVPQALRKVLLMRAASVLTALLA